MKTGVNVWARRVVAVAILLAGVWQLAVFAATPPPGGLLRATSPAPENGYLQNNPAKDAMTNHLLIYSNHGMATKLELGAYFPRGTTGTQRLTLIGGARSYCLVSVVGGKPGRDADFYQVSVDNLNTNGRDVALDTQTWHVKAKDACISAYGSNTQGDYRSQVLDIPAGLLARAPDDTLTGLKKLKVTVTLATGNFPDPFQKPSNSLYGEQTITFQALLSNASAYLGNIETATSSAANTNNGLIARQGNPGGVTGDNYVTAVYPFGKPCTDNSTSDQLVTLFDADVQSSTPKAQRLYFTVWEQETGKLPVLITNTVSGAGTYIEYSTNQAISGVDTILTKANSGDIYPTPQSIRNETRITLKNMKPHTHYKIYIRNWLHKESSGARNNYLYVGLPGDSIYGASNFECPTTDLVPDIEVAQSTAEPLGVITPTSTVYNNGVTDSASGTQWQVTSFVLPAGQAAKPGADTTSDPCAYFGGQKCIALGQGSQSFIGRQTVQVDANRRFTIPIDAAFGSQFCFVTSVKPYNNLDVNKNTWRHSTAKCVTVGLLPKLQVWGYDVLSGKVITTRTSLRATSVDPTAKLYGSWGEYGVFPAGKNGGPTASQNMVMASGSGLAGGNVSTTALDWSRLTAANVTPNNATGCSGSELGCYAPQSYPVGLVEQLKGMAGTCSSASLTLPNASLGNAAAVEGTHIICSTGTVTIRSNIQYKPTSIGSLLPQVIIIAKNIEVQPGVSQVDAWLVADKNINGSGAATDGRVYTCSSWKSVSDKLRDTTCPNTLVVNGPIIAYQFFPGRTAGVRDPNPDVEAERVNLRADTFIWASQGSSAIGAQTVSVTELPPRY